MITKAKNIYQFLIKSSRNKDKTSLCIQYNNEIRFILSFKISSVDKHKNIMKVHFYSKILYYKSIVKVIHANNLLRD